MKRIMISVLVAVALLTSGVVTSQFGHGWVGVAHADCDGGGFYALSDLASLDKKV